MKKSTVEQKEKIKFSVRHYQIARLYGPGMEPSGREGYQYKIFEKSNTQIGLVSVHGWNLGEINGPYPIKPGTRYQGEAADWVPKAHNIIENKIKPVLDIAREKGVTVFHLGQFAYSARYPQFLEIAEDPELQSPQLNEPVNGCVNPRTIEEQFQDQYGSDYPGPVWVTHVDSFDIAESIRPLPTEPIVLDGWQLNGLCRRLEIDILFYVGFMADLCLVNIPGAMREMANKFRYYCVVIRDCTTAYEYKDTHQGKWMNKAVIRQIETDFGYSITAKDFIQTVVDINLKLKEMRGE